MHKTTRLLLLGVSLSAILVACSGSGASSSAGGTVPSVAAPSVAASEAPSASASEPAASASASASPAASASASASSAASASTGEVMVTTAESSLGQILVDGEGKTLYMFTPDEGGTPTCYDDCATAWPPLTTDGTPTAGPGVTATLTTVDRTDGTKQVKAGEYPLYYFASDTAAGDTTGQGVGGKWFVVGPDGEPIEQ